MNYNEHVLMLLESINNRLGHLVQQKSSRKKRTRKETKDLYTEEFNSFWDIYPRKARKLDAAKAYHKAVKAIDEQMHFAIHGLESAHELLHVRAMQYVQAWPPERLIDGDYRQHAATWLNQETYLFPESFGGTKKQQSSRGPQWKRSQD